ncbi:MAG: divalent metal cation transporter [Nitrososphaeraceae archaeon]
MATYSQAGSQFGFGMLWLALFQFPLMPVVQEMCARMGLVTGSGLASVIKKRYSRKVVFPIASLLLIANTIYRVLRNSRIPLFIHRKSNHLFSVWQHAYCLAYCIPSKTSITTYKID